MSVYRRCLSYIWRFVGCDKMLNESIITKSTGKILFLFCLITAFICLITSCSATMLTEYTELNTNNSVHIKTELDLSVNYTVLFDNENLEYKPKYDIIKTGLAPDSEHSILSISDNGQIQTIETKTLEGDKIPLGYAGQEIFVNPAKRKKIQC